MSSTFSKFWPVHLPGWVWVRVGKCTGQSIILAVYTTVHSWEHIIPQKVCVPYASGPQPPGPQAQGSH